MAKKKSSSEVSDSPLLRDKFRERNAGVVEVSMNSKRSTDNYYVDRDQLATHQEYDFDGEKVKARTEQAHIKQNARLRMGDSRFPSSNKQGQEVTQGFSTLAMRHPRRLTSKP